MLEDTRARSSALPFKAQSVLSASFYFIPSLSPCIFSAHSPKSMKTGEAWDAGGGGLKAMGGRPDGRIAGSKDIERLAHQALVDSWPPA